MRLDWSDEALGDLVRLYDFLASAAPDAAVRTVQSLVAAAEGLVQNPWAIGTARRLRAARGACRHAVRGTV